MQILIPGGDGYTVIVAQAPLSQAGAGGGR